MRSLHPVLLLLLLALVWPMRAQESDNNLDTPDSEKNVHSDSTALPQDPEPHATSFTPEPSTYTLSATGPYQIAEPTGAPDEGDDSEGRDEMTLVDVTKKAFCRAMGNQDLFFQPATAQTCPGNLIPMTDNLMIGCVDSSSYILQDPTKCPSNASIVNLDYVYCAKPNPNTKLCPPGQAAYFFPVDKSVSLGSKPPPIPEGGRGGSTDVEKSGSSSPTQNTDSILYCHSSDPKILGITKAKDGSSKCSKGLVEVDSRKLKCLQKVSSAKSVSRIQNPSGGDMCLAGWDLISLDDFQCYSTESLIGIAPSVMGQCKPEYTLMYANTTANDLLRMKLGMPDPGEEKPNTTASLYVKIFETVPLFYRQVYCYDPGVTGLGGPYGFNFLCQDRKQSQVYPQDIFCRRADDPSTGGVNLVPSYDDFTCDHGEMLVSIKDFICAPPKSAQGSKSRSITRISQSRPNNDGGCSNGGILVMNKKVRYDQWGHTIRLWILMGIGSTVLPLSTFIPGMGTKRFMCY
ncbi:hypothetical protein BJ684DRAFT_14321 [Piptocephalis cylindrospora]|uniref:Uncharacterized protein n=1 Tax=Piptocephalis cylindrospora TaxID=1907219 RepID=A0A4P9Y9F9_9FUNG|nr:hypothetical protein BJ684DRAFT_14321 [Piptocephalis cylindrospora]|eukprot:RKP15432.1 hypothetical protein BJ684DRAFT_14321 [Piptocephalis cylindrospora]